LAKVPAIKIARERMSAHHDPIDVIGNMREESGSVAVFEAFENFTDLVRCAVIGLYPDYPTMGSLRPRCAGPQGKP